MGEVSDLDSSKDSLQIKYIREDIPEVEVPVYKGERNTAFIPDTLDLQERAGLAVNGLTGPTDPDADYEIYWRVHFLSNPPLMYHGMDDQVQVKFWQALPLMRIMSGSTQDPEVEKRWLEVMLKMQGEDGLLYTPVVGRPWALPDNPQPFAGFDNIPKGGQFCTVIMMGRILGAFSIYAELDPDGPWRDAAIKLTDGLCRLAIIKGDKAYMPAYVVEPGQTFPDDVKPPKRFTAGTTSWIIQGLAQCGRMLDYTPALELAGKLVNYMVNDADWFDEEGRFLSDFLPEDYIGDFVDLATGDSGQKDPIHFHAHANTIMAVLEYIQASGDRTYLEWAKKCYAYARNEGEALLGWFPEWISGKPYAQTSETCQVADMVTCALKLSQLGEDRWDDAERWIRNQLVESQLVKCDWIYHEAEDLPETQPKFNETVDRVPERNVGAFAGWPSINDWVWYPGHPHRWTRGIMHCCTGNGARALFYAWDSILDFDQDTLAVNLLLNRASPWADIESHLPYTGRVDIRIKQAVNLKIRIPDYVSLNDFTCKLNDKKAEVTWEGRYACIGEVASDTIVTITFPLNEKVERIWNEGQKYTVTFKGHDVVEISPPGVIHPLYRRDHYRENSTRFKKCEQFCFTGDIPDV